MWGLRAICLGALFALPVRPVAVDTPSTRRASGEAEAKRHHRHDAHHDQNSTERSSRHKHRHRHKHHHKHKGVRRRQVNATVSDAHANTSSSVPVKAVEASKSMISSKSEHRATSATLSSAQAVQRRTAEVQKLRQELEKMKGDLRVQPSEMSPSNGSAVLAPADVTTINATLTSFHALAARKEVTDTDLKEQLHVLCNMLAQLEASEAVKKEAGQQEIDALKAEVATLREEIEKCKLEEQKAKAPLAPAPAPAAPAPIEFDCNAGYPNWKLGWSQAKKDYCCKNLQMGCEFDCDAGLANWKRGWSEKKKEYCCQEEGKGCKVDESKQDQKEAEEQVIAEEQKNGTFNATGTVPANATEPFDCDAGLANWEKGWSEQKKAWCCKEKGKGCLYDCDAGVDNWEKGWSQDKKEFCCEHADVACKFDCAAGFPNWEKGWSEEKKEWCCVNKQTPTCPEPDSEPPVPTEEFQPIAPAPATPAVPEEPSEAAAIEDGAGDQEVPQVEPAAEVEPASEEEEAPPKPPDRIEPPMPEETKTVGEWDRADESPPPSEESGIDIDGEMPYGDLEPFGREDTAQELTEASIKESDEMVDQLERAEVAEEKRAVFRALTRLRGAAITSFDGIARSQTGNIDEYNKENRWRGTHPLHHLADEESDVNKWAFPEDCD